MMRNKNGQFAFAALISARGATREWMDVHGVEISRSNRGYKGLNMIYHLNHPDD